LVLLEHGGQSLQKRFDGDTRLGQVEHELLARLGQEHLVNVSDDQHGWVGLVGREREEVECGVVCDERDERALLGVRNAVEALE